MVKDKFGNAAEETAQVRTSDPAVPDMGDAKPNPDQDGPEYSTTTTIQDDQGNSVVIPGGFHLDAESGTSVEDGIVIEDANGNQFVWIPTGTYNVTPEIEKITETDVQDGKLTNNLIRRAWGNANQIIKPTEVTVNNGDGVVESYFYGEGDSRSVASGQIAAFKASAESVENGGNGGFYIGRYEQGAGNVCKYNQTPYVNITRDTAKSQAQTMYGEESSVVSELISSYAWDTALNFICQTNNEGYNLATTTSSNYGNIGTKGRKNTGVDANDNYSKIHDLLGNCWEWSTEYADLVSGSCVRRGGRYDGNVYCAAYRSNGLTNSSSSLVSFRVQIYVK